MRLSLEIMLIMGLVIVGCAKKQQTDKVTYVSGDDPKMNAAIAKARSTIKTFTAALKAPKPGQSGFSVKMAFTDNSGHTEHMWLVPVSYDGTNFQGTVANEPEKVMTVKLGQKATVAPSQISDWMFIENRKLVGGETLRVMHDSLSPAERADFDKSLPFVIN